MYKKTLSDIVVRLPDITYIPNDPYNSDWKAYQSWLENGNTPEPAETASEKKGRLMGNLRSKRDSLLRSSDFKRFFPRVDQEKLMIYLQALRDMPESHTTIAHLENPSWPEINM